MAVADISGRRVLAQIYTHPTHGPVCERKLGHEAGADTLIEKLTDEHVRAYPVEFARYQASRASIKPVGIPLKRGLGLDDDLIRLLNAHAIMDVETFAAVSDTQVHQLMPGNPELGIELRDRAGLIVPPERRTPLDRSAVAAQIGGPANREAAAAEIEMLKQRLAQSEAERLSLVDQIDTLTAPVGMAVDEPEDLAGQGAAEVEVEGAVRRGPGRPRRAA